jgi:hypothetical protein
MYVPAASTTSTDTFVLKRFQYDSKNKDRLLPQTALTSWSLQWWIIHAEDRSTGIMKTLRLILMAILLYLFCEGDMQ